MWTHNGWTINPCLPAKIKLLPHTSDVVSSRYLLALTVNFPSPIHLMKQLGECFVSALLLGPVRSVLVMPPRSNFAALKTASNATHIRSRLWLMKFDADHPHEAKQKPALSVGDEIKGTVTRVAPYGAFVRLPDGQSGLIHISEIADGYVSSIKDHVSPGDQVLVRVLSIDSSSRKISLSIRQTLSARATGYDRVVELGGDWGDPWNDDGNTTFLQLSTTPPPVHPHHWEPDLSIFEPFDADDTSKDEEASS